MLSQCIKNGDPGIGYGSTIRGYMSYGGKWMRCSCLLSSLWSLNPFNDVARTLPGEQVPPFSDIQRIEACWSGCSATFMLLFHRNHTQGQYVCFCQVYQSPLNSQTNFYVASLTWNPSRRLNGWIQSRWDMELSTGTWRTEICMWSHIVFSAFANV